MYVEIISNERPGKFKTLLFDNTRSGKDNGIKLNQNINNVFSRFIRGACNIIPNGSSVNLIYCLPDISTVVGTVNNLTIFTENGSDGYLGKVYGILSIKENVQLLKLINGSDKNYLLELKFTHSNTRLNKATHIEWVVN